MKSDQIHKRSVERIKNTPVPKGQKFLPSERVWVKSKKKWATVVATFAHAYGNTTHQFGDKAVDDYILNFDDVGEEAWYHESDLEARYEGQ